MPQSTPLLKLCGITRFSDAWAAMQNGYSYLGFNFVRGGKRFVDPAQAATIVAQARDLCAKNAHYHLPQFVGVFQDESAGEVEAVLRAVPLDALQFHGSESVDYIRQFDKAEKLIIKVFAVDASFEPRSLDEFDAVSDCFLFDTKQGGASGGTGEVFDWSLVPPTDKRFFLAGGLGPANLRAAVQATRPFALDLNSKLEIAPGIKDPKLIAEAAKLLAPN
jgi:phosphoribosylanthranilate isomerase